MELGPLSPLAGAGSNRLGWFAVSAARARAEGACSWRLPPVVTVAPLDRSSEAVLEKAKLEQELARARFVVDVQSKLPVDDL